LNAVIDAHAAGALIVGLMAAQFLVHAAGWAMTALMQRRAGGAEGHFALFWLALALAAALQVPALHGAAAAAEVALVAAALAVHRGLLLFYRAPTPDRVLAGVLALALAAQALALADVLPASAADALASALVAATAAAGSAAFWRHGRERTRSLALAAAAAMGTAALGMAARALALGWAPSPPPLGGTPLSAAFAIGLFFLAGLFNLAQIRLVLGRVLQQLMAQSQRDALTGVANRRGFMLALDKAHRRALRERRAYALLMVDIDHFKRINDSQGHAAGDAALRAVALQLGQGVRGGDLVGRLGGEEFGVLLPGSDLAGAEGLAERLRETVAAGTAVTVSIGVALADGVAQPAADSGAAEDAESVLARADAALYRAKREGRNRVVVSP
jgi:diguanylate cyclase (GGDEF)-like protein